MEKDLLYKSRSFSSCILAAYQLMSKNLWTLIKSTWLPVLLCAVLLAIFMAVNLPNEEVVAAGAAHFALYIGMLAACLIGIIFTDLWAFSRLMSMLNEESRRWNLGRAAWLLLHVVAITAVLTLAAIGIGRLGHARLVQAAVDHYWLVLGLVLAATFVVSLLLMPLTYVAMKYLNECDMRFWHDLASAYRTGLRRLSFIFITLFISGIIVSMLMSIVMLPYLTLTSAYYTSLMGYLMGDPSDLPGYFFVLFIATAVAVFFLLWYVEAFLVVVAYFMYGSIEKRREEQRNARLEEQQQPPLPTTELTDIPPINLQS